MASSQLQKNKLMVLSHTPLAGSPDRFLKPLTTDYGQLTNTPDLLIMSGFWLSLLITLFSN